MFKVPTAILFDNKENFISFGHEAEDDYTGYADSNEEKDYLFFYRFKMSLYKGTVLSIFVGSFKRHYVACNEW